MNKLYIVIPAYNEEVNIFHVVREWHDIVTKVSTESRLIIINDGSNDNTYEVLKSINKELRQLTVITKPNSGHGATVLYGYNYALEHGADYIFQTDSDGQTIPSEFWQFWEIRDDFSAIIGYRNHRKDGFSRILVAKVLKLVLWCIFKLQIIDANTPFRLIRRDILKKYIVYIPANFNLSNIMLTVCLVKHDENIKFIPISFMPRQGGVNSTNFRKIIKIGRQAVKDFRLIRRQWQKTIKLPILPK
jgi:glycosyltransferase involved in cell wall biosynthesis